MVCLHTVYDKSKTQGLTAAENMTEDSYTALLHYFETSLTHTLVELQEETVITDCTRLWDELVEMILNMMPLDLARRVLMNSTSGKDNIECSMQEILAHNADIDFSVDANYMSDNLCVRYADDPFVLRYKSHIVINFKIIKAFFALLSRDYGSGFFSFRWILQFIIATKLKCQNYSEPLFDQKKVTWIVRQVSLYLAKCLNLDYNQTKRVQLISARCLRVNRLDILKGILFTILEYSSDTITDDLDSVQVHVMAEYFKTCGEIYEFMALLEGNLIDYEHARNLKTTVVVPHRVFSVYMIRHYMLAAVHSTSDNPSRLISLHKVLVGLLFVGAIPIESFNHFHVQFHQSIKHVNKQHFITEYANYSLSGTFINIIESIASRSQQYERVPNVLIRLATNEVIIDSHFDGVGNEKHKCSEEASKLKKKVLGSDYDRNGVEFDEPSLFDFVSFWKQINAA